MKFWKLYSNENNSELFQKENKDGKPDSKGKPDSNIKSNQNSKGKTQKDDSAVKGDEINPSKTHNQTKNEGERENQNGMGDDNVEKSTGNPPSAELEADEDTINQNPKPENEVEDKPEPKPNPEHNLGDGQQKPKKSPEDKTDLDANPNDFKIEPEKTGENPTPKNPPKSGNAPISEEIGDNLLSLEPQPDANDDGELNHSPELSGELKPTSGDNNTSNNFPGLQIPQMVSPPGSNQPSETPDKESDKIEQMHDETNDNQSIKPEDLDNSLEQESQSDRQKEIEILKNMLKNLLSKASEFDSEEEPTLNDIKEEIKKEQQQSTLDDAIGVADEISNDEQDLSNANQGLMDRLKDIPSFTDMSKGPGYVIDTHGKTDVPDSVVRTLITKFLNQRFCKRDTDLNVRTKNSLEKTHGFQKWDVPKVAKDLESEQITQVLKDKYGYEYSDGKDEKVPLSFYFDMSGSMASYSNQLAVMAIELLKKGVKVLVGFNECVNYQINEIPKNLTVKELAFALLKAGAYIDHSIPNEKIKSKPVNKNIDTYLIGAKAEKCVVFADFHPIKEVINLSNHAQVYWFCFEKSMDKSKLSNFKGFLYPVQDINDIEDGLMEINVRRFEAHCYFEKEKVKVKLNT